MKRRELTKTCVMISNWKNPLVSWFIWIHLYKYTLHAFSFRMTDGQRELGSQGIQYNQLSYNQFFKQTNKLWVSIPFKLQFVKVDNTMRLVNCNYKAALLSNNQQINIELCVKIINRKTLSYASTKSIVIWMWKYRFTVFLVIFIQRKHIMLSFHSLFLHFNDAFISRHRFSVVNKYISIYLSKCLGKCIAFFQEWDS